MINLLWSAVCMVVLLSGCGWSGSPTRNNDFTPLTSIVISADSDTIAAGTSTRLSVTGVFLGGHPAGDITDKVIWSSGSKSIADFVTTVPSRVKGLTSGSAVLTATVGGVTSTFKLTVSSAKVTALTITPVNPSIAKGNTAQFTVSGAFDDATTQDLTFDSAWESSNTSVATIGDIVGGKRDVKALAAGTSTISATFEGVGGSTLLTATEPALQSIALSPANPSILTLSTGNFTATGTYSDGSTSDISSQVTWNSSNKVIAENPSSGAVTPLAQGTTTISAALGEVSGTTTLKATGGNLVRFTVSPAIVTLVKDTTVRINATGTFDNGSIRDITGAVTWSPTDSSLATVTKAGGSLAWLNALAVTPETFITAASGSLIPIKTSLVITEPLLLSLALTTTSLELTAGTSSPLAVIATFGDGTTQDVTSLSVWAANDTAKATVAAGELGTERVTGVAAGLPSATISASYGGKTVPIPATVTVKSRNLQNLTISPVTSSVTAGNLVSFTARASYGDGTIVDVTNDAIWTWVTDKPNVAILCDSVNQPGQVLAVDSGTATLTATFGGKIPAQNATIIVTGP